MRLLPLFLCGCPYLFGAPDLSKVDGDTDTDTDADSDTDTDADTDSDTDADPTGSAPTVVLADPFLRVDHLELSVSAIDVDDDLIGGSMALRDAGKVVSTWAIPNDFTVWDSGGISLAEYPFALPCNGWAPELSLTMTDFAGHESDPFPIDFKVGGVPITDGVSSNEHPTVGTLPITWCSTADWIDDAGTPGTEREKDKVTFDNPVNELLLVSVDWSGLEVVDIDLEVYRSGDASPAAFDVTAYTEGHAECPATGLDTTGDPIEVRVFPFAPDAGAPNPQGPWDYQVIVQVSP